jgi:ABC-type multidrug transport system fused ATPase/permease subunit
LALTASIGLATQIFILLQSIGEGEAELNAVERLVYYSDLEVEQFNDVKTKWITNGAIEFEMVDFRYPSQPNVSTLKQISFSINAGERIGIVGRTGSGKSTLVTTLKRNLEIHSGRITIDGIDISTLDLYDLRSQLHIIPQKAIVFTGTIRSNMDPFSLYTDQELWDALKAVGLLDQVESKPEKLDVPISSSQQLFSAGQLQLFEIAKAILAKPKILILDEATASVDKNTDTLIQQVVLEQFQGTTVLAIAHRLETLSNYDKILVLDQGKVIQFDTPDSVFLK